MQRILTLEQEIISLILTPKAFTALCGPEQFNNSRHRSDSSVLVLSSHSPTALDIFLQYSILLYKQFLSRCRISCWCPTPYPSLWKVTRSIGGQLVAIHADILPLKHPQSLKWPLRGLSRSCPYL